MGTKGIGLKTKAPHCPCFVSELCEWCSLANFRQGGPSLRPPGRALHHGDELRRPLLRLLLRGFRLELRHLRVQHLWSVSTPLLDKQSGVGSLRQGLFVKRGFLMNVCRKVNSKFSFGTVRIPLFMSACWVENFKRLLMKGGLLSQGAPRPHR